MIKQIEKGKIGGWRPNSGRKPGFIGYWRGKKRDDFTKEKISRNRKGKYMGKDNIFSRLKFQAENHPRWNGGSWLYWKKQVLIRDNYTCQKCFLYDPEVMTVDHIIPVKKTGEKRNKTKHDISNLQTLCANCHLRKTKVEKREGSHCKSYYSM